MEIHTKQALEEEQKLSTYFSVNVGGGKQVCGEKIVEFFRKVLDNNEVKDVEDILLEVGAHKRAWKRFFDKYPTLQSLYKRPGKVRIHLW